ncbi:PD-(D/E)XK nuclease superfamily protein [Flavobacterium aquaticum]|uniref:PD-(D/E)XK nuclease superfamily protein n=1 Tax=Flavobacterium aquaticum TaxID=1236486 RepID=A0A327YUU1_9FLAO|nr:PD-(D/E)XK nuclease family protein [Flavobacterium aquaticum]RAK23817.1 PD-(D/E)XK nuclease superfamily protein [Flavobacterium aquaticum]
MKQDTFLDKLSAIILSQSDIELSNCLIVLPNKRAKVFLLESLKNQLETTSFAPTIISIEDFIQEISGLRTIDPIELLFEFYEVYLSVTEKSKQQTFEEFATWAKTAIQDFNEIDRYLLDSNHVFSYLEDIEALKRWDLQPQDKTKLITTHLEFWAKLPLYYESFYEHLLNKGIGYQGLLYREAVKNLVSFTTTITNQIFFAGFNALNQAEERIFKHLANENKAKIYWDIDEVFLNDSYHDAGLFIRKFKKEWKPFVNQDFEWVVNHFSQEKNIEIIGTPKSIGQAKIVGTIIEKIQSENPNLEKTAVVLGDENLLLPVLYGLPESVDALNITMGYPSKNNPAQLLISKLFKLHTNAKQRNEKSYTFYYKEVLDILNHPLVEPYCKVEEVVKVINNNNFTFFSNQKLFSLYEEKYPNTENKFFKLLFTRWDDSISDILVNLNSILLIIKSYLSNDDAEEKVTKAFVYSVFKTINKLTNYHETYDQIESLPSLQAIYKQIIDLAEVSFEGEPLSGLQVMGVLESRVLDFENVIITSVNEGKFPAGKSQNSFIPYDVKKELGLPTYKEKDAIYCYHFYHLLLRAKNVWLLYNTDNEGIDAGEKSRFITQLEIEKQPKHNITSAIYNAVLPEKAYEPVTIPKTDKILTRLQEIATDKGFSPSSLTNYIRNPLQFYMQRILRINEADEVEENIAVNTLGTIIHNALEELYTPYLNQYLALHHIEAMEAKIDEVILKHFKEIYKEGEITKGKNLLAFEVAKRNVYNFLQLEKKDIEEGQAIKVLLLEASLSCEIEMKSLSFPIKIAGKVDRIEERNGTIRIIDYKTGKVLGNSLKINDFTDLTSDIKNEKIIQLLCYALMFENHELKQNREVSAGIVSFKNMKSGFLPFGLGKGNDAELVISNDILQDFKSELETLILEIFNPEIPFKEKV